MGQAVTLSTLRPRDGKAVTVEASIEHGRWTCNDPDFLQVLNMIALPHSHYYPDRDLALAQRVTSLYGGAVSDTRPAPNAPTLGAVD